MVRNANEHLSSQQAGWDLYWKVLDPAHLLFYAYWLCVNYIHVIIMLLLVSCMSACNHLICIFPLQVLCRVNSQNRKQKCTRKNFAKFPNHFPQLKWSICVCKCKCKCKCICNWPLPIGVFQEQCKQIVINKHNLAKNPNWREADQLAIYKRRREVELGATENNIS